MKNLRQIRKCILRVLVSILLFSGIAAGSVFSADVSNDMAIGFPIDSPSEGPDMKICPVGARVINAFLYAWEKEDYAAMYELLADESKRDYSLDDARFDFQFLEFKSYKIIRVSRSGENFEFLLSYGDWKDGDKDIRKMVINGKSFKIIMPSRNSPFKRSAEDYF